MMTPEIEIVSLEAVHRTRAADALTRAFLDDPMWRCVLPDREARGELLRPMWRALIDFARIYGEALTTPEGQGAACWIAPGKTNMTLWKMLRTGMALPRSMIRLPKEARGRFFGMMRVIDEAHKELMPGRHWYLLALGVAPEVQGRGIGRRLIAPILERSDRDGSPCYLETQTEGNVAFYRKSGFEVIGERREPVCDLPIWFLRRESGAL
jgi:ribosomal protein S18 acetylase RimI-like enzyme